MGHGLTSLEIEPMMRPDEVKLKNNVLDTFIAMVDVYRKLQVIEGVDLYYDGHTKTRHGADTEMLLVTRRALVAHWERKLQLEASNLRSHGIDPSSLLPKGVE